MLRNSGGSSASESICFPSRFAANADSRILGDDILFQHNVADMLKKHSSHTPQAGLVANADCRIDADDVCSNTIRGDGAKQGKATFP